MIRNIEELIILLNCCDKKLEEINSKTKVEVSNIEIQGLKSIHEKRILNYIAYFKAEINDNHLESKLFENLIVKLDDHYTELYNKHGRTPILHRNT